MIELSLRSCKKKTRPSGRASRSIRLRHSHRAHGTDSCHKSDLLRRNSPQALALEYQRKSRHCQRVRTTESPTELSWGGVKQISGQFERGQAASTHREALLELEGGIQPRTCLPQW